MSFFLEQLQKKLPSFNLVSKVNFKNDSFEWVYVDLHNLDKVVLFLRDHTVCQFKVLTDITAVDYPERLKRFEIIYFFLSVTYNARIFVKCVVDEFSVVPSLTSLFNAADWYEREVWDMFGIYFSNHNNLWRLLTDYGFEGHPLRKDFPLTGFFEVRYDEIEKRIVSEKVELAHEFKVFTFSNPWPINFQVTN